MNKKVSCITFLTVCATALAAFHSLATAEDARVRLDPKSAGRVFEGVGAVSAGATSVFLMDYPEPVTVHRAGRGLVRFSAS